MRTFLLLVGGFAVVTALFISMALNFLFGMSLGQTATKQYLFGGVSIVVDLWKALGPVFIQALSRHRHMFAVLIGMLVWVACLLYGVSCALGLVAQDRGSLTGGRETLRSKYQAAAAELQSAENSRQLLKSTRTVAEIESAIASVFARPIRYQDRVRGTVETISERCTKADSRTADACAEIALLRQERATAAEAQELDNRIAHLKQQAFELRDQGGALAADPQAELLSRLSLGRLSAADISQGLIVLLAAVLELVSAFGPVVLASYAHATRLDIPGGTRRDTSRFDQTSRATSSLVLGHEAVGIVLEFLAECAEASSDVSGIDARDLVQAYETWCSEKRFAALTSGSFVEELDAARYELGLASNIRKVGDRYFGLRLKDSSAGQILITKRNASDVQGGGRKRSA